MTTDPWLLQLDRLRAAGMTDAQIARAIDRLVREWTYKRDHEAPSERRSATTAKAMR